MALLIDGTPDPCDDPANHGTQYCQTRQVFDDGTPETPAEWNLRTGHALEVTVNRGISVTSIMTEVRPWLPWIAGAALIAFLARRRS